MAKKNYANLIILVIISLLCILLILVILLMKFSIEINENEHSNATVIVTGENGEKIKSIKEIIDDAGSTYISESGTINLNIYVKFKYDLYDENGRSRKSYFYDIINKIEDVAKKTFYLKDEDKRIEIGAIYNPETESYKILINKLEDFYNIVDSDTYIEFNSKTEIEYSNFTLNNSLINTISQNSAYYAYTLFATEEGIDLENGYYSFQNGTILAKLQYGKALNIIFREGYEESFAKGVYVKTSLSEILEKYPNPSFGNIRDGYLGYITELAYIFFYKDEVSVYPFEYKENTYFDEYIKEYCEINDLEKLVSNFTTDWTSYFEKDYDEENGNFKITFPLRGIEININKDNPYGIFLYKNYYLTDEIKDLIKAKKITYIKDKDYIDVIEKNRYNAM